MIERLGAVLRKKTREKEKESGRDFSTHKLCARKGEERERERSLNHEEVQREFVSKLTRYCKLRLVKEWCFVVIRRERERENTIVLPRQTITFSTTGGSSFSSSSSSCARCFVPVFSRSRANSANDDDSPFCTYLSLLRYT